MPVGEILQNDARKIHASAYNDQVMGLRPVRGIPQQT